MDFAQLVESRRTVHMYKPDKVDDTLVRQALLSSLWAPNHRLTFPWCYLMVGPVKRAEIAELAVELKREKDELNEIGAKAVRNSVLHPSHWVAMALRRHEKPGVEHEDYATLACSVQIASLYLWQHGIGTKWSTGAMTLHKRTYDILDLSPAEYKLEGALLIGVPQMIPKPPKRPELADIMVELS